MSPFRKKVPKNKNYMGQCYLEIYRVQEVPLPNATVLTLERSSLLLPYKY